MCYIKKKSKVILQQPDIQTLFFKSGSIANTFTAGCLAVFFA